MPNFCTRFTLALSLAAVVPFTGAANHSIAGQPVSSAGAVVQSGDLRSVLLDLTVDAQPRQPYRGQLQLPGAARGGPAVYVDDFSEYPRSDDPIFARFQVNMQDQYNSQGGYWTFSQAWHIPTLFIDGQFDESDPPKPDVLPRWQGADLVENQGLGALAADINGDGVVNAADLGILIGGFGMTGAPGFNPADINSDGVIDAADLGLLIAEFGTAAGPFCVYLLDEVHTTDPDGLPLDPGTIGSGPAVAESIAIVNSGSYSNDVDADGCPDCAFFRIDPEGGAAGEQVYGTWSLIDAEQAVLVDSIGASVLGDDCAGWGEEACLCDARGEANVIENQCCFLGARFYTPAFHPSESTPLTVDFDIFLTDLTTFQWIEYYSAIQGISTGRIFMGGYAASLSSDFLDFTNTSGFMEYFVVLGNRADAPEIGEFFGTRPNALTGATGIKIKTGEWFTVRLVIKPDEMQYWVSDSETRALVDPLPGDNGDSTPFDGSDDIEDGFAKIFPTGPFGSPTGSSTGEPPAVPAPVLAAVMVDGVRFLWAGDPTNAQVPDFEPSNVCYDNIVISGELHEFPDLPAFKLDYLDDVESYTAGAPVSVLGSKWIDLDPFQAVVDDGLANSGTQSIRHSVVSANGSFREEVRTQLPSASANSAPWTAGVSIALSGVSAVRTIALLDNVFPSDESFDDAVARILTGVENENGIVVVDGMGRSTIHVRVPNPGFNPAIEPDDSAQPDAAPDVPPVNSRYLNVPTDALSDDAGVFHRFTFEVDAVQQLVIRRDGVLVSPDPALAPLAGYAASGWTAGSVMVDEMRFECGNQPGSFGASIWIDDVTLDGFEPEFAVGPAYELPYADGFEDYPINAPIDGQGETTSIDQQSISDVNLCIEQGAQALNLAPSDPGDWCEYRIKSDAVGGIASPNDWGLADGDTIYIRQADCNGPVACKQLQCFTNPNRPGDFIPNAALFDDPIAGVKAPSGVRIEYVAHHSGFDPLDQPGICDTFEWDTYDPANIFCRYTVDSINDADEETPGPQNTATPSIPENLFYYVSVGGKITVGDVIAVDQVFDVDPDTGLSRCPGVVGVETEFKIVDPCGDTISSGMWTLISEDAAPLDCADVPHFGLVYSVFPRYLESSRRAVVLDDPTGSGLGNVLRDINDSGFNEYGESIFAGVRSFFPPAYAGVSDDCVFEVDCYVVNNNSRYTIDLNGPLGAITQIQLGGPDLDTQNSPGEVAVPATNFALLENNPGTGGPFGMGPDTWYWDTGIAVPLNAWFRLRATVNNKGEYTIAMDQSGVPGGDGVFETAISTVSQGSAVSGRPLDVGAGAIDGFDTNTGLDFGGDGVFSRDPIEITQISPFFPGDYDFPDDFCFYNINDIDGIVLGNPPAPCNGVFGLNSVIGVERNAALPNWPNGGVLENCPDSPRFIWNDQPMSGQCSGEWRWLDPDDPNGSDYPDNSTEVDAWATYTDIPPYADPGPASQWIFDNISLDGSPIQ